MIPHSLKTRFKRYFSYHALVGNSAHNLVISQNGTKSQNQHFTITCLANFSVNELWWTVLRVPNGEAVNVTKTVKNDDAKEATLVFKELALTDIGHYVCNAVPDGHHLVQSTYTLSFKGMGRYGSFISLAKSVVFILMVV